MSAVAVRASVHRLVLRDRNDDGGFHLHRWVPSCTCGQWWGINARTRDLAAAQFRGHENSMVPRKRRRRGGRAAPGPRAVTPDDRLPEQLRSNREDPS